MFKKLTADAILPKRQTRFSAGFDVFANEDKVIAAGQTELIGLGIAIDSKWIDDFYEGAGFGEKARFKASYYFELHIRSSLRVKGLTSLGTGVIDMDFDQEIKMVINNPITDPYTWLGAEDKSWYTIKKGDKIGQLILLPHAGYLMPSDYTLDNERVGGFGSSGVR